MGAEQNGKAGAMLPASHVVEMLNKQTEPPQGDPGAPAPVLMPPQVPVKLDLGCGENCQPGFEGVDYRAPSAKHKWNLLSFPWPLADESVDELHCSHFIEHIPLCFVWKNRTYEVPQESGKDMLVAFFDECYRVLKPGGTMKVIAPYGASNRAWQDPTHRRPIFYETFMYLALAARRAMKLEHYNVDCNFLVNVTHTVDEMETLKSVEASHMRFRYYNNVAGDIHATLKKLPKDFVPEAGPPGQQPPAFFGR